MAKDFLLDTNVISAYLRFKQDLSDEGSERFGEHLAHLNPSSRLFISVVTFGEIEYGLQVAPLGNATQHNFIRNTLSVFPVFDVDKNVSLNYAILRARLFNDCAPRKKKQRSPDKKRIEEWIDPTTSKELQIQENDLWIAAVAMTYNMVLVSNDKMNAISRIANGDVELEDWLA